MSVECTSCGHLIPAGQFRCGKCGGLSPRQSMEDFGGLAEIVEDQELSAPAPDVSKLVALQAEPVVESPPRVAERAPEATPAPTPDAASTKDPIVPKGTFASEAPEPVPAAAQGSGGATSSAASSRPVPVVATAPYAAPEVPAAAPGTAARLSDSSVTRSAAQSSSQRIKQVRAPVRPPFLASESLREDLAPLEPGQRTFVRTLQSAGAVGIAANALVAFDDLVGWLCASACAALVLLGRLPLSYLARAKLVTALAGCALIAVVLGRLAQGAGQADGLLVAACAVLPGALLFRTWYRSARVARVWVGASLVLAFTWAALTSHRGLLMLEFSWQSWVPALAWYVFGILCLLSLLAFMGDETTGGCHAWALGISLWFGLFACLRWALERDTLGAASDGRAAPLGLTEAALAAPFAVALAQVFARVFVKRSRVVPRAS